MTGLIHSIDRHGCRGWAVIPSAPQYSPIVHLECGGMIRASAIADQPPPDGGESAAEGRIWFSIDMPASIDPRDCRVLIGETREFIADPRASNASAWASGALAGAIKGSQAATYRDGLNLGLEGADIVELLYLDILRRSADSYGLEARLRGLNSGEETIESIRHALIYSDEYRSLRLPLRDAPGRIFSRRVAWHSSLRRRSMEAWLVPFTRSLVPLDGRLIDFFPGLVAIPDAIATLLQLAARGVPDREIFCRALSLLSARPSLILPGRADPSELVLAGLSSDGDDEVDVPCTAPHFALGWHGVEPAPEPRRWMEHIGLVLNPQPGKAIERIEISIAGWLQSLERAFSVVAGSHVLQATIETLAGGPRLLVQRSDGRAFNARHIALVAAEAACPWRLYGSPDPRLLSCSVSGAKFFYEGGVA